MLSPAVWTPIESSEKPDEPTERREKQDDPIKTHSNVAAPAESPEAAAENVDTGTVEEPGKEAAPRMYRKQKVRSRSGE
jgi:hypothetical protein